MPVRGIKVVVGLAYLDSRFALHHACQHSANLSLVGLQWINSSVIERGLAARHGRAPLVLSRIFPLPSLKDVSKTGPLEKYAGVLYVSLYISFRDLTLALAGLAFVAYWGIVLFGYDTCVVIKCFIAGSDAFFILSEVSGTLESPNMWF